MLCRFCSLPYPLKFHGGALAIALALLLNTLVSPPTGAQSLHRAAESGDRDVVENILAEGADPEMHNEAGETPLTIAALAGHTEVVALLLERGAKVGDRNARGLTALHAAAYSGHLEIIELLVAQDAPVNDQDNQLAKAPLHLAAEENHLEVAQKLILAGATIDPMDLNDHSPASVAAFRLHEEMVILLRMHGAGCQSELLMGLRYQLFCLGRRG